jgi:hypothetical protein
MARRAQEKNGTLICARSLNIIPIVENDPVKFAWKRTVVRDIDLILWSIRLENIRRYHGQKYWEQETIASDYACRIEGFLMANRSIRPKIILKSARIEFCNEKITFM